MKKERKNYFDEKKKKIPQNEWKHPAITSKLMEFKQI